MDKQITIKEIRQNMEYLVKMLHREWECSGETEVTVRLMDVPEIECYMAKAIEDKQKQLENKMLSFQQNMELSRNNFVLLRLVKKVKNIGEKSREKGSGAEILLQLDKEEYQLLTDIVEMQEGNIGKKV